MFVGKDPQTPRPLAEFPPNPSGLCGSDVCEMCAGQLQQQRLGILDSFVLSVVNYTVISRVFFSNVISKVTECGLASYFDIWHWGALLPL